MPALYISGIYGQGLSFCFGLSSFSFMQGVLEESNTQ